MLLSMITAVSRHLCLDFDFPENYTHINLTSFLFDYVSQSNGCSISPVLRMILKKSNEVITFCIDFVREFYDHKHAACTPLQPPTAHLFCRGDNAENQAKNNYHFSWMVDFVEEDHGLQTTQQNFEAQQDRKGSIFVSFPFFWKLILLSFLKIIILKLPIHTMRHCTKSTSMNFTTSLEELFVFPSTQVSPIIVLF